MKVQAKGADGKMSGFYGNQRRYPGDVFEIDPKAFSESWMVKLEEDKPKRKRKAKVEPSEEVTEVEPEVLQEAPEAEVS